jgi:chromate transporter
VSEGAAARAGEVARVFLKLGVIGFGGPAAHIALFRDEIVRRRKWVSEQRFLDLLGITNLIPGPNSTEMAIYLGWVRAGWPGLVLGGSCFIGPAMLIVLALAWLYVRHGARPEVGWALAGVTPVIIAVIAHALWSLLRTAVKGPLLAGVGLAALALAFLGVNQIALLFGGGVLVMLVRALRRPAGAAAAVVVAALGAPGLVLAQGPPPPSAAVLTTLALTFLKIGAVLYGTGYVLLAFLRADFVERLGWLTDRQLLDAIAIGQFTPGPLLTTATFVGYLVAGLPGGVLATVAIFLPSFGIVALSRPLIPRVRDSAWTAAFLDGVNVAAVGLMAAVAWQFGRAAVVDVFTALLALAAAALLLTTRVNSAWLVLGGGLAGLGWRALVS